MAQIPAFSAFSAVSELFVTASVFYVLWRAYRRDDFRGALLAVTLAFETLVNIVYMALRVASHAPEHASPWMQALLAAHGTLSLLMFVALLVFSLEAFRLRREGRNLLREHPRQAAVFVAAWSLSVLSGEAIFLLTLLR